MDGTPQVIWEQIGSLRKQAAEFRCLAAQHRAAASPAIARKLTEVAAELEAKATLMEDALKMRRRSAGRESDG
jgi:hypothetical protein